MTLGYVGHGICYFIAEQYWEVSVQTTASGTTLSKTLLDCNGMEGSSSVSSQGLWTMEAWVMNWVIWDIYEWCLLCHGGAAQRGGRKPIAELPNVAVQTAWWLPSSTSGSMTGPQWNRRSFFHFHHWVIWTDEAWGMNLGYMGNLWVIFVISLRSCTERYGGHLFVVLLHHGGVVLSGTSTPGYGSIRLGSLSCRRLQPWVLWDIYERYLLFLCGAVLKGMGKFLKA